MFKHQVRSTEQAFAYLIDCTLATVAEMAMKKSRGAGEFKRQKQIAQTAINWAREFGVPLETTRAAEVLGGTVDEWAKQFDVKESV